MENSGLSLTPLWTMATPKVNEEARERVLERYDAYLADAVWLASQSPRDLDRCDRERIDSSDAFRAATGAGRKTSDMEGYFLDSRRLLNGSWRAFERDVARLLVQNAFEDVASSAVPGIVGLMYSESEWQSLGRSMQIHQRQLSRPPCR